MYLRQLRSHRFLEYLLMLRIDHAVTAGMLSIFAPPAQFRPVFHYQIVIPIAIPFLLRYQLISYCTYPALKCMRVSRGGDIGPYLMNTDAAGSKSSICGCA